MTKLNRRQFSTMLGATTAAAAIGMPYVAHAARPKVVVIGRWCRGWDPPRNTLQEIPKARSMCC